MNNNEKTVEVFDPYVPYSDIKMTNKNEKEIGKIREKHIEIINNEHLEKTQNVTE